MIFWFNWLCIGFLDKWFDEVESALIRMKRKQPKEGRIYSAFTLDNIQVAFYALAIGWTISFFVFLMELYWDPNPSNHVCIKS